MGILIQPAHGPAFTVDAYPGELKVGVHAWENQGVNRGISKHRVRQVPVLNANKGYEWLQRQIGKDYDHRALLGYAVNRVRPGTQHHLRSQDKWTCWPLAYGFLMASWAAAPGLRVPRVQLPNQVILPSDLSAAINKCWASKGVNPFDPDFLTKNDRL